MMGDLYDRALDGERCWIRRDDGEVRNLPVRRWLGGQHADEQFDRAIVDLCDGPTIDLGCGPGRLVVDLIHRGIPALGVDQSATAAQLARRIGAPVLCRDLFDALPGTGHWRNALLADGNIGLGGDPRRLLRRVRELLSRGGRCIAELDPAISGVRTGTVRLESSNAIGPWFRWASVGVDSGAELANGVGLVLTGLHPVGSRVLATLAIR
ncbi:SAM-dependent methyltransferase [Mycobacterium sp. SMC-4]|uniref:SAM-dependent methyltransferase n=1 Tax=Mycobacterium sp. SMC-4 TaxID=2857059 RepID=UPI003D04D75C